MNTGRCPAVITGRKLVRAVHSTGLSGDENQAVETKSKKNLTVAHARHVIKITLDLVEVRGPQRNRPGDFRNHVQQIQVRPLGQPLAHEIKLMLRHVTVKQMFLGIRADHDAALAQFRRRR
jgi:hypothetical protein